ncbi:MAG: alginate export family protein, partial [Deltaproteobacteria bacterium]|nr:alginate export family protein [Deltaproteobacteria bacterium]
YKDDPEGTDAITDRGYEIKLFAANAEFSMYTIGLDGGYNVALDPGKLFFKWDAMYQGGKIKNASFTTTGPGANQTAAAGVGGRADDDFDMKAYFLHLDAGFTWDKSTLTYTFWYASGDDDPEDGDFEGYVAVDVDSFDNHVLFESLCDDNVFTERHYLLDKGFIMNRVRFDYQATDKLKAGVAAMYMMTAEDIEYLDNNGDSQKNDKIGFELDADMSYTLFQGLTFNLAAGYLFADDAMDYFEEDADGNSDENIFRLMSSIRYKF